MKKKEKDYTTILLEEIRDQNKTLIEGQKDQATRADVQRLEQRLEKVESDVQTIKAVVTATNRDMAEHKRLSADEAHGSGHTKRPRWWPA